MANWTREQIEALRKPAGRERSLPPAIGKLKLPDMNKTEVAYSQYLELQRQAGEVLWYRFGCIKFRVGENCWFNVDFLVMYRDGHLEAHDTKGTKRSRATGKTSPYAEDDAIVKARATAESFPVPVYFVWREKNGEWSRRLM